MTRVGLLAEELLRTDATVFLGGVSHFAWFALREEFERRKFEWFAIELLPEDHPAGEWFVLATGSFEGAVPPVAKQMGFARKSKKCSGREGAGWLFSMGKMASTEKARIDTSRLWGLLIVP